MASKKARQFLESNGVYLSHHAETSFATGSGHGKLASPYHIVAVDSRYGSSKRTVGYARTATDAKTQVDRLRAIQTEQTPNTGRGGGEYHENKISYYVRDVRQDETIFNMKSLGFKNRKD